MVENRVQRVNGSPIAPPRTFRHSADNQAGSDSVAFAQFEDVGHGVPVRAQTAETDRTGRHRTKKIAARYRIRLDFHVGGEYNQKPSVFGIFAMPYLAAISVDQRQTVISASDKLKEMLGGSYTIAHTKEVVEEIIPSGSSTQVVMPVSGDVWLSSTDLGELKRILWECRRKIVEELDLPCTFSIVEYDDLDIAKKPFEEQIRRNKESKCGEDGSFSAPLAAFCQIQPKKHANLWDPSRLASEQGERRALVSASGREREKRGQATLEEFLSLFSTLGQGGWKTPKELRHLVIPGQDQFLALIKADGDGMGAMVSRLKWGELAAALKLGSAEEALERFSTRVDEVQNEALKAAVDGRLVGQDGRGKFFPVVPIIRAGEDTAILCRRDLAMTVALCFGEEYAQRAADDPILQTALEVSGTKEKLTLSFGVLFAKQGYPFEVMWELAEELLHNAKTARKRRKVREGLIDFFWFASSGRADIKSLRSASSISEDGKLFTRPWTLQEARRNLSHVAKMEEVAIPPGKWTQLDTVLRMRGEACLSAFQRWLLHLKPEQRCAVEDALKRPEGDSQLTEHEPPWWRRGDYLETPLLEFVEILKTQHLSRESTDAAD